MRKTTIGAGLLAFAMLACGEPAARMMGAAMQDVGEKMIADSGGSTVVADAGRTLRDAGRTLRDAAAPERDAGTTKTADAQEVAGDGLPRAHWVLQDKNGKALQAEVAPAFSKSHTRGDAAECVTVTTFEQKEIRATYELGGGSIGCSDTGFAKWHDSPAVYLTDQCDGAAYSLAPVGPVQVDQHWYWTDGAPTSSAYFIWNGSCTPATAEAEVWKYQDVPDEVTLLLLKPPYSLELVY